MRSVDKTQATKTCEGILHASKNYNLENGILQSENKVIDHLLERHVELVDAYAEIYQKLQKNPFQSRKY